jgi:hypothetical protein
MESWPTTCAVSPRPSPRLSPLLAALHFPVLRKRCTVAPGVKVQNVQDALRSFVWLISCFMWIETNGIMPSVTILVCDLSDPSDSPLTCLTLFRRPTKIRAVSRFEAKYMPVKDEAHGIAFRSFPTYTLQRERDISGREMPFLYMRLGEGLSEMCTSSYTPFLVSPQLRSGYARGLRSMAFAEYHCFSTVVPMCFNMPADRVCCQTQIFRVFPLKMWKQLPW